MAAVRLEHLLLFTLAMSFRIPAFARETTGRRGTDPRRLRLFAGLAVLAASAPRAAAAEDGRWFADRPVAWFEHDDASISTKPQPTDLEDLDTTLIIRDGLAGEVERVLSLEGASPARDVNAADEVPCSTWFCPRHHLHPMTPAQIAAGPPAAPPVLPFTITKGKDEGAATGFQVVDARGKRFMLKLDPEKHFGMSTAGELVGYRVFHAAGYNVPGAFHIDVPPDQLRLGPKATFKLFKVRKVPLTMQRVQAQLAHVARLPDGRFHAVAVPWVGGEPLGGFDLIGRRVDDPNDRIPHQHRRSLRATWVLYAWLSVMDPSAINTIDSIVEEGGRRFIRHYHFDFGCAFGSATAHPQTPHQKGEFPVEVGRSLRALFSLGLYHRPFQDQRDQWTQMVGRYRAVGDFPADDFDPDSFRTNRKLPTHVRMTDRDAYWGAKIVTSFTDADLDALMGEAALPSPDAEYARHALAVRRDILGRRYLRAVAAVEEPAVSADGASVCFRDLAITRGYAQPREATYQVAVSDGFDHRLLASDVSPPGPLTCVPIAAAPVGSGYRVVSVSTRLTGGAGTPDRDTTKASRIHLRWREAERRFVVVGLERDE